MFNLNKEYNTSYQKKKKKGILLLHYYLEKLRDQTTQESLIRQKRQAKFPIPSMRILEISKRVWNLHLTPLSHSPSETRNEHRVRVHTL